MDIINEINITGTLVEAKLKTDIFKKGNSIGKQFISGEVTVKCMLDGVENLIPLTVFSSEATQDGKPSKLFETYSKLPNQIGQRLTFARASLEEHRYVNKKGEVTRLQRIKARFVNEANLNTADSATFSLNGYVVRGLEAKKNKDNEVYLQELIIGQSNYRGDAVQVFHLNVRLDEIEKQRLLTTHYAPGSTVSVDGDIRFITQTREVQDNGDGDLFGEPMKKVYVSTYSYFYINHASKPLHVGEEGAYTQEQFIAFKEARNAEESKLLSEAKSSGAVTDNSAPLTGKAASLL